MVEFDKKVLKKGVAVDCDSKEKRKIFINWCLRNGCDIIPVTLDSINESDMYAICPKGYGDSGHLSCSHILFYENEDYTTYSYDEVLLKPKKKPKNNIKLRRTILNEMFKGGKFGTIHFIKKDGSERKMNCRIKRVDKEKRKGNHNNMTFWEVSKEQYRSVRLDSIISVSGNNDVINFRRN